MAFFAFAVRDVERGNVEDVGVVPANAQSAVRKNEFNRVVEPEQSGFVRQDAFVDGAVFGHRGVTVGPFALPGLGKVTALNRLNFIGSGGLTFLAFELGAEFFLKQAFDQG